MKWLVGKTAKSDPAFTECVELRSAAQEFAIRELCLQICIDLVANAIGRCEFRTYRDGKEVQDSEYYMLNVEPNLNQNSTEFWHKVVTKLYLHNECLIISARSRKGQECLVVADSWLPGQHYPAKMDTYTQVQVGDLTYDKTFHENEVLHLKLNQKNIRPALEGLYSCYTRMLTAAENYYEWKNGVHMKVHVSTVSQTSEKFMDEFQERIKTQVQPFTANRNSILPEFDGYDYQLFESDGDANVEDTRKIIGDVFDLTARAMLIPAVLVNGTIEGTADANHRFLSYVVDPLCDQIQEELNRKRYGFDAWKAGSYVRVDTSSILHFDIFSSAANIEKLVGSGLYSLNDVLRAANQDPIDEPWANDHYMTLNITEMGQATRSLEGGENNGNSS